jgi:hypothetical protein
MGQHSTEAAAAPPEALRTHGQERPALKRRGSHNSRNGGKRREAWRGVFTSVEGNGREELVHTTDREAAEQQQKRRGRERATEQRLHAIIRKTNSNWQVHSIGIGIGRGAGGQERERQRECERIGADRVGSD